MALLAFLAAHHNALVCAAVLAIAASPALSAYSHTIAATYLLLRLLRFVWHSHYMPLGEYVETCFRPSRLVTPELFDNVGPGLSCVYLFVVAWVLSIPTTLWAIFSVAPFLKESLALGPAFEFAERLLPEGVEIVVNETTGGLAVHPLHPRIEVDCSERRLGCGDELGSLHPICDDGGPFSNRYVVCDNAVLFCTTAPEQVHTMCYHLSNRPGPGSVSLSAEEDCRMCFQLPDGNHLRYLRPLRIELGTALPEFFARPLPLVDLPMARVLSWGLGPHSRKMLAEAEGGYPYYNEYEMGERVEVKVNKLEPPWRAVLDIQLCFFLGLLAFFCGT